MKSIAILALVASVSAVRLSHKWVDENGLVHPFYIPNDEALYEERYKAANRNQAKHAEKTSEYKAHPTKPVGYAWDTHNPDQLKHKSDFKGVEEESTNEKKATSESEVEKTENPPPVADINAEVVKKSKESVAKEVAEEKKTAKETKKGESKEKKEEAGPKELDAKATEAEAEVEKKAAVEEKKEEAVKEEKKGEEAKVAEEEKVAVKKDAKAAKEVKPAADAKAEAKPVAAADAKAEEKPSDKSPEVVKAAEPVAEEKAAAPSK